MIDYERRAPYEPMYDSYTGPLDNFEVSFVNKGSTFYGNYSYDNNDYPDCGPDDAAAAIYHSLLKVPEYRKEEWHDKLSHDMVAEWTKEDTVNWLVHVTQKIGFTEYQIPYCNFHVSGMELLSMTKEEMCQRLHHLHMDPVLSQRIAESIFEKLHHIQTYRDSDSFVPNPVSNYTDLDQKPKPGPDFGKTDFSDEDPTQSVSPGYYSDASSSRDEEDKKPTKRPPGRPPGTGRKPSKKTRSVSVPEFLRNMLLNPKFCPSIIKWEDYSQGKFRFVKPDEVAKQWGRLKNNDGMTFEKFSRAMRYHYRQLVLVSVPTARLVYQFGVNGPKRTTNDPNFTMLKKEDPMDLHS